MVGRTGSGKSSCDALVGSATASAARGAPQILLVLLCLEGGKGAQGAGGEQDVLFFSESSSGRWIVSFLLIPACDSRARVPSAPGEED